MQIRQHSLHTRLFVVSPTIDRFDKILMTKETLEDIMGAGFDHKSFRLKKAMLNEIKYVYRM